MEAETSERFISQIDQGLKATSALLHYLEAPSCRGALISNRKPSLLRYILGLHLTCLSNLYHKGIANYYLTCYEMC